MTEVTQPSIAATAEPKQNDKEHNIAMLRQKYERELAKERAEKEEALRLAREAQLRKHLEEDEEDEEPYIDKKKLKKEQEKFGQRIKQETQSEIQQAVQLALQEERKQNWLRNNNDFYEVMQHADKMVQKDPELAETILKMPDTFERQQLVYRNIKALGLHLPPVKEPSIQDKIDSNRRSPYYQPSGISSPPYAAMGDFSKSGQKQSYEKMQELKNRLRLG